MTTMRRFSETSAARVALGIAVSALFVVVTLTRVDLGGVARAMGRAAPALIALGLAFAILEVAIRAWRWQALLAPFVRVPYRPSAAYLCIGYFANALLPVRLGDAARAYLAGTSFGASRLAVLGTVLVERLADGIIVLLLALVLGLEVAGGHALVVTAAWVAAAVAACMIVAGGALTLIRRTRIGRLAPVVASRPLLSRLAIGGASLRNPLGLVVVSGSTLAAFAAATAALACTAASVGITLSPMQAGLAMAAIALSTAIPAAPSSLGTYELVGLSILTALGAPADGALAAVVILHVLATLPVALAGLAFTWHYHMRVSTLVSAREPATS